MNAAEVQITNRQTRIRKQLPLDAETSLLHVRLRVILRKQVKTRIDAARTRRRAKDIRIDRTWVAGCGRAGQTHARYLYAVVRVRRAEHDRRRASEENSVTTTHHRLFVKCITEAKTGAKLIVVANRRRRLQADCRQRSTRITHCRIGKILKIVTQTEIQRKLRANAPVVLKKQSILIQIRMGSAAGGSRTGK